MIWNLIQEVYDMESNPGVLKLSIVLFFYFIKEANN